MGAVVARSAVLVGLTVLLLLIVGAGARADGQKVVSTNAEHVAIQGYDAVAYFTDGKPMKGDAKFLVEHDDARWYFASAEHRDLFAADPERYMPQYGGYCAGAAAQGEFRVANPEIWAMVEGKLYIYSGALAPAQRNPDTASVVSDDIRRADAQWPEMQHRAMALRQQELFERETGLAGFDAVAYFTDGRAVMGHKEFAVPFEDRQWYFASAAHRDLFRADPKRYAPQYRGFSAIDLAQGRDVPGDPEAWIVVAGKLYLNHSLLARNQMARDPAVIISKADAAWAAHGQ
jgi:YHS domain-containing protein